MPEENLQTRTETGINSDSVIHSEARRIEAPPLNDISTGTTPTKRPRRPRQAVKKSPARKTAKKPSTKKPTPSTPSIQAKFPRHTIERSLRIPRAILEQNAGHPCPPTEAAKFLGMTASGAFGVEVSSAKKYGFLESVSGNLALTDRAKRALRPQTENDELSAMREAALSAPDISDVYKHYRGEHIPDDNFFNNALGETFKIPNDKIADFREIFTDAMRKAELIDDSGSRPKLIDIGREDGSKGAGAPRPMPIRVNPTISTANASCFVIQPFSAPYGGYYELLFKPAIEKAGLKPVRADDEIFGSGKIMDQVWRGIRDSKVLLAELTTRNANVYYELGLAHALGKPVVLIAAEGENVPFDLQHIRVVYYDTVDPFWGQKLVDKIAENVSSALSNPEEAVLSIDGSIA